MATCYRPTTLKLASHNCPRALDFYEERRPYFREHFSQGIAAHDCLAAIGELAIRLGKTGRAPDLSEITAECEAVVRQLITHGRRFEGEQEPPMIAEDAFAGQKLALDYAMAEGREWPISDVWYERGLAFDAQWKEVAYRDPTRRFRLIADVMAIIEDGGEDYSGRLGLVRDYKSAWPTDESELETIQMKGQAVAAAIVLPDLDGVRREVVNLRTGQIFRDDIWLESGGREQLAEWRAEVDAYMDALDKMRGQNGQRPARPGAGCLDCAWVMSCDAKIEGADQTVALAQQLAQIEGQRKSIIKQLKVNCAERPLVFDGSTVGWHKTEDTEPTASAGHQMFAEWQTRDGDMAGFLAALKPGMTSLRAVAKTLYRDDKDEQARCIDEWTQKTTGREFGIKR